MTDRPIIMSAPMVRALLEGRKTQTRRLAALDYCGACPAEKQKWQPGDRLWVREAFSPDWADDGPIYKADGGSAIDAGYPAEPRWKPSIHMPRWASRLTLLVRDVRVERLQDISEADAMAEGCMSQFERTDEADNWFSFDGKSWVADYRRDAFAHFWGSLHGAGAWEQNPWVAAISFDVVKANIDAEGE